MANRLTINIRKKSGRTKDRRIGGWLNSALRTKDRRADCMGKMSIQTQSDGRTDIYNYELIILCFNADLNMAGKMISTCRE